MSKGELWKGVAISAIIALAFGGIAYHIISYALQMVGVFGEGMGVDARSREIYAETHKVVHIFAAACGLAIGWFHYRGNKALRWIGLVAIVTCGGYGILNMYGFTSTNRVSVAAAKEATKAGAEREYQAARNDLTAQIDWLQKTASGEEGRERRRLLSEVDAKRKELSALRPPVATAETVIADTQSWSLGKLTHTDPAIWMIWLPLVLACIVFFVESFSCIVVGHMAAAIVGMFASYWEAKKATVAGSPEGSGGKVKSDATVAQQDANVVNFPAAVKADAAQLQATPKVSAGPPRVPASAPSSSLKSNGSVSVHALVAANPGKTWEGLGELAREAGVSIATASRATSKLASQGKLERSRKGRGFQMTSKQRRNGGLQVAYPH